ncbi:MAG: tetratricopeptide repeat protein [Promethearchaeota archaeon]
MSNLEPHELTRAKKLIEKNKYDKAFQVLSDFEEIEGNTLINKASCHLLQCQLLLWQGKYEDVILLTKQTYNESLGLGKSILTVDSLLLMVEASLWIFRMNEAFDVLKQAEKLINALSEEMPNEWLKREAYMFFLKGVYNFRRGKNSNLDHALEYIERSLELRKKGDNELDIGFSFSEFGVMLISCKSEIERGLEYINQAFELGKKYDNNYLMALATRYLMLSYARTGELDLSIKYGEQSLELFKQINNKSRTAALFSVIGELYREKGEIDRSIEYIEQALEINKEFGINSQEPLIFVHIIQLNVDKGDFDKAQKYLKQLEQLNNQVDNPWVNLNYRTSKAQLLKHSSRIKDLTAAAEIYKELIEEKTTHHNDILLDYCDLLIIELGMTNDVGILDEIQFYLNELVKIAERSKSFWVLAETYFIQAKVSLITLDLIKARRFLIQGQQIAERQGYQLLAIKFAKEYEDLKGQEHLWENFKATNASISERMKLAKIGEQMEELLRNRKLLNAQITENKVTVHKEQKTCLVCKGEIIGYMYVCNCDVIYCEYCARALTELENVCWSCNAPLDKSKPITPNKTEKSEPKQKNYKKR